MSTPSIRRWSRLLAGAVAAGLLLAGCGGGADPESGPTAAPATSVAPQATVDPERVPPQIRAAYNSSRDLPGAYFPPHPGPDGRPLTGDDLGHFDNRVRVPICAQQQLDRNEIRDCYHSNPPTSGPHAASPAQFRVHDQAIAKENLLHNMEHGGVVVWYNTANPAAIATLTTVVNEALQADRLVVMSPYDGMEPETIALTSWTRLDKFSLRDLSSERVVTFIDAHERRFNPEGF